MTKLAFVQNDCTEERRIGCVGNIKIFVGENSIFTSLFLETIVRIKFFKNSSASITECLTLPRVQILKFKKRGEKEEWLKTTLQTNFAANKVKRLTKIFRISTATNFSKLACLTPQNSH